MAVFTLASYLAATAVANAAGDSTVSGTDGIKKVGYTTTKSSGHLKWLPYCPQSDVAEEDMTRTEHIAQWTSAAQVKDSRQSASNSIDDHFDDRDSAAASRSADEVNEPMILPAARPGDGTAPSKFRNVTRSTTPQSLDPQAIENSSQLKGNNSRNPNTRGQTLEQSLAAKNPDMKDGCPSVKDLKKISQLTTNIKPSPGDLPRDCPWGGEDFRPRSWAPVTFSWTASGLCHHPLYFEDVQLERYGHATGPWAQPFVSAAHFFLCIPVLPYKMGLELPDECIYTLGYYRPGSCAPYMLDPIPLSIRAGLFEAGAWVAGAAIIP